MRPTRGGLIAVALCAASSMACKDSKEGEGQGAVKGKPVELGADEFYADYAGLAGAEILTRYAGGVVLTGRIAETLELGESDGLQMSMAVKGEPLIQLRFADAGERVRRRQLAPGSVLTVRCRVGGKPADVLYLLDCQVP